MSGIEFLEMVVCIVFALIRLCLTMTCTGETVLIQSDLFGHGDVAVYESLVRSVAFREVLEYFV
jgi:hypothetical protein